MLGKITFLGLGIGLVASASASSEKVFHDLNGTELKYDIDDTVGQYNKPVGFDTLNGEIYIYNVENRVHSGYFNETLGESNCEGEITIKFNHAYTTAKVDWLYDGGYECKSIGRKITRHLKAGKPSEAPSSFSITKSEVGGSGKCSNVSLSRSGMKDVLTIKRTSSFEAYQGEDVSRSESRKFCTAAIELKHESGWQYSIEESKYTGHVKTASSAFALLHSSYRFPIAGNKSVKVTERFSGGLNTSFNIVNRFDKSEAVWSPCDGRSVLNLKSEIQVRGKREVSSKIDVTGDQKFVVRWRKCEN